MGVALGQTAQLSIRVGAIMIILAIDTATDAVSVALHDGESVVASSEIRSERQHAEALTPMIDFVCKQANLSLFDIGAVAVDIGPGLFTGMRVGIASAQAIAQVLELPMAAITSLDAIATEVPSTLDVVASIIDARRGEVYWSLYRRVDGALRQVGAPQVGSVEQCAVEIIDRGQSTTVVGTGALQYRDEFTERLAAVLPEVEFAEERFAMPSATTIATLAHELALRDMLISVDAITPLYLRPPDAEINWATRSAS